MADSEGEPVTPTKPYHESLADKRKALGVSQETGSPSSPSLQDSSPSDRATLHQIRGSSRSSGLPVGCMVRGSMSGSTFPVSPAIKTVSQLNLTAPGIYIFSN